MGGWRDSDGSLEDDALRFDFFPVNAGVGVVVGANGGTSERDSREEAARARIGQDFSAHSDVGFGGSIASNRASGGRRVSAKLHFALEDGMGSAIVHNEKDEVGGLAANLKSDAAALNTHRSRSAPTANSALAAGSIPFPILSTKDESAHELDVLLAKAGASVPSHLKAGVLAGYRDMKIMAARVRQPRTAAAEPSNVFSLKTYARSA